ncbi:MAG: hypothetical protein Q4G42_04005, partial [Neisseria sp.]|nr:hypothetical protein [Neisseria sp.]
CPLERLTLKTAPFLSLTPFFAFRQPEDSVHLVLIVACYGFSGCLKRSFCERWRGSNVLKLVSQNLN